MSSAVYIYASFVCAVTGFLCWRFLLPYLRIFPFFILGSGICEYVGKTMGDNRQPNTLLYNYLSTAEFTFYLFLISFMIVNRKVKAIVWTLVVAYPIYSLLNIYLVQGPYTFHTFSYCTGCLLMVLVCVYYFYELFQLPETLNLLRQPAFWICSGLLIFCTVSFPLIGLTNYIYRISPIIILNLRLILNLMNTMLFAMFTVSFLCRLKNTRKPVLRTNG